MNTDTLIDLIRLLSIKLDKAECELAEEKEKANAWKESSNAYSDWWHESDRMNEKYRAKFGPLQD